MVEEKQLDPAKIPASGKDGRITKGDVVEYLDKPAGKPAGGDKPAAKPAAAPAVGAAGRQDQRVPMTRLRARIAERLLEAQQTQAQLTTFNEIDLKAVMDVRAQVQGLLREETRREARLHVLLREGRHRSAQALPGGERLGRRQRHRLPRVLRHRRRGLDGAWSHGARAARRGSAELRRHREEHRQLRHARRGKARSPSKSSPAARSPSPTAAHSVRCCLLPSSTCRRARSSACTPPRSVRWW